MVIHGNSLSLAAVYQALQHVDHIDRVFCYNDRPSFSLVLSDHMTSRYHHNSLVEFAVALCGHFGMSRDAATDVANILVEGDLLGHDTHGLQLLKPYLQGLEKGAMTGTGDITVLHQRAAIETWDGKYLPGPHLTQRAIDTAIKMARQCGTGTIAIRQSSHIGALAAYLEKPARDGYLVQIVCSDPSVASVAPFGGSEPLFTPNPMAWGIPTSGNPIMVDISASTTTNGMSARLHGAGKMGEHEWWLDENGQPTKDPSVIFNDPPGSLLPLGGNDAGHKGFGLALFVEAMTCGLGGHGRTDGVNTWGASVCVQVTDISAFGEASAFHAQMDYLVERCVTGKPANPEKPVRVPGQRGLALKLEQMKNGIALHPDILPALADLALQADIEMPGAL